MVVVMDASENVASKSPPGEVLRGLARHFSTLQLQQQHNRMVAEYPRATSPSYSTTFLYIYIYISLSPCYCYYATTTIPEGARQVDHQARPGYSSAGIDHRGLLFFLGGPGRH